MLVVFGFITDIGDMGYLGLAIIILIIGHPYCWLLPLILPRHTEASELRRPTFGAPNPDHYSAPAFPIQSLHPFRPILFSVFADNQIPIILFVMRRVGVDNYLLLEEIGEGSYGKVYRGMHTVTNQEYAVKVIPITKF